MAKKFPWTASVLALAVSSAFAQSASQTTQQSTSPYQLAYLDPVVVTANRYEEEYRVIPAYVTYISRKDIEESNAQTVNEAIIRLGGLVGRASLYGGREQNIDIMGFGDTAQSNLVILLDGMPLNNADASESRISGIPIDSVETIEIHRSSAGVLYGNGANGGVINIITNMSQGDKVAGVFGSAYAGFGSFTSREYRVTARRAAEGLSLFFSGAHLSSDGYRENSMSREKTGFFSARYDSGPLTFGLSALFDHQNLYTPGPLTEAEFRLNPRAAQPISQLNKTYNDSEQQGLAIFAEMDAGAAIVRIDAARRDREVVAVANIGASAYRLGFDGTSEYWGVTARRQSEFSKYKNHFLVGYERSAWDQTRSYVPAAPLGAFDQLTSVSHAYFLKNDLDIKQSGTRITAGYRDERNERTYAYDGPPPIVRAFSKQAAEVGVSQRLERSLTGYVKVSRGYRFANLDEFSNAYAPDYSLAVLRPQESRDIELGLKFSAPDGTKLQARVYQNKLKDEIIYDVLNYTNINLDRTQRRGIDLDGSIFVTRTLRLSGAASIREAIFSDGKRRGKEIPMSLPKTALLGASWQPAAAHRFGVDAQWVGSQHPAGDYENLYRVPSYWVANLRYDYRLGSVDFAATVKNLFDRSYYSYATIVPADWLGNDQYIGVYPDNGRSVWASVRYRFN